MKKKRILFIDYIRALAILMVIMCHVIDVNCLFWLGYQEMSGAKTDHPIYFVNLWQMWCAALSYDYRLSAAGSRL